MAQAAPSQTGKAPEKEFKVGLAMAGAVSAGAYSAGVFDFLMEALSEWEKARARDPAGVPAVPDHRTVLAAFSGASAGSITAAIGLLSAWKGAAPNVAAAPAWVLPELYDTWVVCPDLTDSPVGGLLDTSDLHDAAGKAKPVLSLLNSEPLDAIGKRAISAAQKRVPETATANPFLPAETHLFMTQTGTRGVPYAIGFRGGASVIDYGMIAHADRAHYVLKGIGTNDFTSPWASFDASKPLDLTAAPGGDGPAAPDFSGFIQDTLASSAFPAGLQARLVHTPVADYQQRMWPLPLSVGEMKALVPHWNLQGPGEYQGVAIDGGVINNQPFDFTRYSLMSLVLPDGGVVDDLSKLPPGAPLTRASVPADAVFASNPRNQQDADRMVVMIAPFPEPPTFLTNLPDIRDNRLVTMIKRLLPVLLQQARFQPEEAVLALRDDVASRWMIVPRRYDAQKKLEPYAIACGALGGFGGFLDRRYREHDYALGRLNCQLFLANWFGLPATNPHFGKNKVMLPQPVSGTINPNVPPNVQAALIPLYGTAAQLVQVPPWPKISKAKFNAIMAAIETRADVLVPQLIKNEIGGFWGWIATLIWKWSGSKKLTTMIRDIVLTDLIARKQI